MYDVVALGELLIDFTPAGHSPAGTLLFEQNPGGAPANVLSAVSTLGGSGAFIGKVGADAFGLFLKDVLGQKGIDTQGLVVSDTVNTTLAFVHLDEQGDRSFSFYRNPGADRMLTPKEVDFALIDETKIFHFGSLSMTDEPVKGATHAALQYARKKGKMITYDPNWRPPLWKSEAHAKEGMLFGMQYANVVKVSEEELVFLTDTEDLYQGSQRLAEQGISLVVVTRGAKGCFYRCASGCGFLPTYDTKVVDTTGAGDAFFGALIYQISRFQGELAAIGAQQLEQMLGFANAAGALCASRKGAIHAMASLEEIINCQQTTPLLNH